MNKIVLFLCSLLLLFFFSFYIFKEVFLSKRADKAINESNTGWISENCLAIKNSDLKKNIEFTVIRLDEKNSIHKAKIVEKAQSSEKCEALLENRKEVNIENGYSFYLLDSKKVVNSGIALLSFENPKSLSYNSCNTKEGIFFSIKKNSFNIWEGYYYLGYDLEPTCKE